MKYSSVVLNSFFVVCQLTLSMVKINQVKLFLGCFFFGHIIQLYLIPVAECSHREKKTEKGEKSVQSVSRPDSKRTKSRETQGRNRQDGAALSNTASLELRQQHVARWPTTGLVAELPMLQSQEGAHTAARNQHATHSLI